MNRADGGDAFPVKTNVADAEACKNMVVQTMERFGRLDVIFNNAGIGGQRAKIADMSLDAWHQVVSINLNEVFYCIRAAIPDMEKMAVA